MKPDPMLTAAAVHAELVECKRRGERLVSVDFDVKSATAYLATDSADEYGIVIVAYSDEVQI